MKTLGSNLFILLCRKSCIPVTLNRASSEHLSSIETYKVAFGHVFCFLGHCPHHSLPALHYSFMASFGPTKHLINWQSLIQSNHTVHLCFCKVHAVLSYTFYSSKLPQILILLITSFQPEIMLEGKNFALINCDWPPVATFPPLREHSHRGVLVLPSLRQKPAWVPNLFL